MAAADAQQADHQPPWYTQLMARGGNPNSKAQLAVGDVRAERMVHLTEGAPIIDASDLAYPGDEDLQVSFDMAGYGLLQDARFAIVNVDPAEFTTLSIEDIERTDYWCSACAEGVDDDDVADVLLECQVERRQILEEYMDRFESGEVPEPPVIELMPDGSFRIFDGYHRLAAAKALGVKSISCHLLLDE